MLKELTSVFSAAFTVKTFLRHHAKRGKEDVKMGPLRDFSFEALFEISKSCDVCQLRIKPLSLKFRPRYEAAGDEFWRAGLQLASMASSQQVSCDWRISRHVTTTLFSDWSAGGGGVRRHAEGGSVLRPCRAVHQVRMFQIFDC